MSLNVFQISRALEHIYPITAPLAVRNFVVQRTTSRGCIFLVTKIIHQGKYGRAEGYPLPPGPPLTSKTFPVNSYYGTTGFEEDLKNVGSYQWVPVWRENAPEEWKDDWKTACISKQDPEFEDFVELLNEMIQTP